MSNILILPCSKGPSRKRYEKTIINGVAIETILKYVPDFSDRSELRKNERVSIWALKEGANSKSIWDRLSKGDYVLFYSKCKFFCVAKVMETVESKPLATELWGEADGCTWDYLIFLENVQEISHDFKPKEMLRRANDCSMSYGNNVIQGVLRYDDKSCNHDTLYSIIETYYDEEELSEVVTEEEKIKIEKDLLPLIERKLKTVDITKALESIDPLLANVPVEQRRKMVTILARNKRYAELVKMRDNYTCRICGAVGFLKPDGKRYAEAHHVDELAKNHLDNPDRMMCLCPTCHRVVHYGTEQALEERKKILQRL